MRVYFDTCSLQGPFDNKTQIRILLESEAILGLLSYVEEEKVSLINSDILLYEINRIPELFRRINSLRVLDKAKEFVSLNQEIVARAKLLANSGISSLDALHFASAEYINADYFCTSDDKLLKKIRLLTPTTLKIVSPIELIGELK